MGHISRREVLKCGAAGIGGAALCGMGMGHALAAQSNAAPAGKATVYFTKDISTKSLLQLYAKVNGGMTGKIGIKLHSGEPKGPNLLPVEFIKGLQATIPNSTLLECNVLYGSPRAKTESHRTTIATNGFNFCEVDIMDAEGEVSLPVPGMREYLASPNSSYAKGNHLTEVAVGKTILNYDSMLVYTHFKGHQMGGFGGSLKNIGIGCASGQGGKLQIHGSNWELGPAFLERMVESGKAIASHFGKRITYINVLKNLSVDCDCNAKGAPPTCPDIGIVASTDILAVDQASIDLVYAMPENHKHDLVERIESRGGLRQLEYMANLQMGTRQYELVTLTPGA